MTKSKQHGSKSKHRHKHKNSEQNNLHHETDGCDKATATSTTTTNRPKNHLIKDATDPYTFRFTQYGSSKSITVRQTPGEDTWPGGALWDIGVLLARVLVMVNSAGRNGDGGYVPRLLTPGVWGPTSWKDRRVLELGCGVGLTGLVAAALGARAVLLTDLDVVIEGVTRPNVESNAKAFCGGVGQVAAVPLCWGNEEDERAAGRVLDSMAPPPVPRRESGRGCRRRHGPTYRSGQGGHIPHEQQSGRKLSTRGCFANGREGMADLLLIGDVAYQHRPGAPSHIDSLLSTALNMSDANTVVLFGTRMRMPASADLLEMFREHFDEVVTPPIEAHEIDAAFEVDRLEGRRHNISVHLMKRKSSKETEKSMDNRE